MWFAYFWKILCGIRTRSEDCESEGEQKCLKNFGFQIFVCRFVSHNRSYNAFFASIKGTPAMRLPKLMLDFEFFAECCRSMRNMPLPLLYTNEFRLPLIIVYSLIFCPPTRPPLYLACIQRHISLYVYVCLLCSYAFNTLLVISFRARDGNGCVLCASNPKQFSNFLC